VGGLVEKMNQKEILDILQEECAEVIQMVSKCRRFGIDDIHIKSGESNRSRLTEEVGDLMCMIQLMQEAGIVDIVEVMFAAGKKREKLKQWSKIYED
jgi:NTP pyrophosphatase (non-canonical NTP hydrolase)